MLNYKSLQLLTLIAVFNAVISQEVSVPGVGTYWVPDVEFRFNEAMMNCWYNKGHLAIINSEREAEVLKDIMQKYVDTPYAFVGFSDLTSEGHFVTLHDVPLKKAGYTAWASGYPNGGSSSNCGAINAKGELADVGCYKILRLICEKDEWKQYDVVEGLGYYKLHSEELTWGDALDQCLLEGSNLLVINSDNEAAVVAGLFESTGLTKAHVGLHDRYKEAYYFTIDGVKIQDSGYDKWVFQEPIKNREFNYVAVTNEGLYTMVNDTIKLPFICEHPYAAV